MNFNAYGIAISVVFFKKCGSVDDVQIPTKPTLRSRQPTWAPVVSTSTPTIDIFADIGDTPKSSVDKDMIIGITTTIAVIVAIVVVVYCCYKYGLQDVNDQFSSIATHESDIDSDTDVRGPRPPAWVDEQQQKSPPNQPNAADVNHDLLPAGWKVNYTADGKIYFQNDATKVTQWERPTDDI